jgi:predicted MPP superfamily phosphohydrolase
VRARIVIFIAIVQSILFLAHWFLYDTWTFFLVPRDSRWQAWLAVGLGLLSVSFLAATLLAMRSSRPAVKLFYTAAAVWVGLLSYFFVAAWLCWTLYGLCRVFGLPFEGRATAVLLFGLGAVASLYGIGNAARTRVKRITVRLAHLPASWQGREVALASDLHLGHVRGEGFARRIAGRIAGLRPEAVFLAGDLYDGTAADLDRLAAPFGEIAAPQGCYYIAGNHEEFRDHAKYLDAVDRAGVRVLDNEKVIVDGLEVVGVHYRDTTDPRRYRSILQQAGLGRERASLLLTHAPNHLPVPAEEGISLALCGHTHGGQFFPFRWLPRQVYGQYVYGLKRYGEMSIYTSSGAGTWGPPLRVGTRPEIVLIRLEAAGERGNGAL